MVILLVIPKGNHDGSDENDDDEKNVNFLGGRVRKKRSRLLYCVCCEGKAN